MRISENVKHKHEEHIADRECNSMNLYNLVHLPIPIPKALHMLEAKMAVNQEWNNLQHLPAWQESKVRNKKKNVTEDTQTKCKTLHFMQHHKFRITGRVVLRGDVVKDASGSYAVFTEQGSSASHRFATA